MDSEKIFQELNTKLKNSNILKNDPMSKHTTFKIGGNADIFVKVKSVDDIKSIVEFAHTKNVPFYIIGNGSNILVKDAGIRGIVIKIELDNMKIENNKKDVYITVESGKKIAQIAR